MRETLDLVSKSIQEATDVAKSTSITFTIGEHFLPALFNSDTSGLSIEEEDALDEFEERALASVEDDLGIEDFHGHWSVVEGSENEFGTDEVTGLKGAVIDIEYVVIAK